MGRAVHSPSPGPPRLADRACSVDLQATLSEAVVGIVVQFQRLRQDLIQSQALVTSPVAKVVYLAARCVAGTEGVHVACVLCAPGPVVLLTTWRAPGQDPPSAQVSPVLDGVGHLVDVARAGSVVGEQGAEDASLIGDVVRSA